MGVVYEALDRERGVTVALKTLRGIADGDALLRFKNEFRSLRELDHPNLVKLFELLTLEGQWFYTMELVPGVDFLEYVRPSSTPWTHAAAEFASAPTLAAAPDGALCSVSGAGPSGGSPVAIRTLQVDRLRHALPQLVDGLRALHRADKVHRDIKPSNILVTRDGRLVLVDFGLITHIGVRGWVDRGGTPGYMAPELLTERFVGPEADWFSVGVVLYQALTNHLPFDTGHAALQGPVRSLEPALPAELNELCTDLLRLDPLARPQGDEILRRLGANVSRRPHTSDPGRAEPSALVGRFEELRTLITVYDRMRSGDAATIVVRGESGIGKSTLVRHFGKLIAKEAIVLAGRCYERESVPYKALDEVVDALSSWLAALPDAQARALVPADAFLLLEAFPVLRRVRALTEARAGATLAILARERRSRVFAAMRELLARAGERGPLVLLIDDLQWADMDSLALIAEFTRMPSAPRMLLVATLRIGGDELPLDGAMDRFVGVGMTQLLVKPLAPVHAEELAAQILADAAAGIELNPRTIASDAAGHPLFIDALVRHAVSGGAGGEKPRLDDALWTQIEHLEPARAQILHVLAVAGRPLAQEVVAEALKISIAELALDLRCLRSEHLAKTEGSRRSDVVEPYHDRVREAVLDHLDEKQRRYWHERLALVLESISTTDPETLSIHWRGAGDPGRASHFVALAAVQAARQLAFERAIRLYRQAISLGGSGAIVFEHWEKLGEALANAGRGAEAAEAYQAAARGATSLHALRLQRLAADQLLRSGHVDDGIAAMRPVLAAYGVPAPSTPRRALASFLWHKALLATARPRLGFRERAECDVSPKQLARLDACWSAAFGLFMVDQVRALDYHARHLLSALAVGEPSRVARGLVMEATATAALGKRRERVRWLLDRASDLSTRLQDPYLDALVTLAVSVQAPCAT
jgi:hypothetical protein